MKKLLSLWIMLLFASPLAAHAQTLEPEVTSILKLRIAQKVQTLRKDRDKIKAYILETHVRKVQADYIRQFQKNGFPQEDIEEILASKEFQDLFDRIRNHPALVKRTDTFLDNLLSPHFIEDRVMGKYIEMVDLWTQYREEAQIEMMLDYQRKVRQVQQEPVAKPGFWSWLRQKVMKRLIG